jgi:hypothetical protein
MKRNEGIRKMETRVSGFSESQREYLLNWFKQKAEMDRVSEEAYRRKKIEKKLIKKGEKGLQCLFFIVLR